MLSHRLRAGWLEAGRPKLVSLIVWKIPEIWRLREKIINLLFLNRPLQPLKLLNKYDVAIIGAGPAGWACAMTLANSGLKIALIDKAKFPRDKICGDAISADVIRQLKSFFPKVYSSFLKLESKTASHGVRFFAPNGQGLDISFQSKDIAPGYICKRMDFDHFLFDHLQSNAPNIEIIQGFQVANIARGYNEFTIEGFKSNISAAMVAGADGANGIVKRKLMHDKVELNHHCAGIRAYYKNVGGIHRNNFIELHFLNPLLPGYFWIFPLPGNIANVGLGVLSKQVSKKEINLNKLFKDLISSHKPIAERFANAEVLQEPRGFGLPIGSKKRAISGDRFVLAGDAAGLIDPFTGEGIGNALRSGRYAAEHIRKCFEKNAFSAEFNKQYDKFVYTKMWNELRISRGMQNLLYYPFLFNYVTKKARQNDALRRVLVNMLENTSRRKDLLSPAFYLKLLRSRS